MTLRSLCFAFLALSLTPLTAQPSPGHAVQAKAAMGGAVDLDLEAGSYDIRPSEAALVRVTWSGADGVRVEAREGADGTRVRVRSTPRNDFKATIEVPRQCRLHLNLTAGELRLGAIEGSKDLRVHAGEIYLAIPDPKAYGEVYASAWAGEIQAPAFGGKDEGLFPSFSWRSTGPNSLRVRLKAGEIHLGL
jgi:hypothetical protein